MQQFIHMGTLTRPHGIRGEVCVEWYADSPDCLRGSFYLQAGTEPPRLVEDAAVRMHRGQPLLRLPHVPDRTAAEGLRGIRVLVDKVNLLPPDDGEAYLHDIMGLIVVDDGTGQPLGVLEHIHFPAGPSGCSGYDMWVIRAPEGHEILFPAAEVLIVGFDLEAGQVRVSPPPGLLDIYLNPSA